ncbi:MAG: phosphotransferase family protein [Rhizobacter sp.]|nr:phosphotransferase family protein [Rhizobacter sp.]
MEAQAGTRPVSEQNQFDSMALQAYLRQAGTGIEGPITVEQFKGGQSNPTYKLVTPGASYVMRAKPGPQARLLPSAHAIEREFRVMKALENTDVPVPKMYILCEDESVIGRAFYIMEYLEGRVLWDQTVPSLDNAGRTALYDEMNRVIAALHNVDVNAVGLSDYGRPGNYFQRQISRWSKQYVASVTEPIPAMDRLIEWLPNNLPATALEDTTSIVHGDYRLDNVMFHPTEPRILAVLDWELSTTGHPLADFSYHCMSWHIPPGQFRGLGGIDIASLGIPSERDYVQKYCERTGRGSAEALMADWNFYLAYNLFRLAAILQGIAKRSQDGTASSDQAKATGAGARPLADLGW